MEKWELEITTWDCINTVRIPCPNEELAQAFYNATQLASNVESVALFRNSNQVKFQRNNLHR